MTPAQEDRAYAREWRLRNGPIFDALYGPDENSERAWQPGQEAAWSAFEEARGKASGALRNAA